MRGAYAGLATEHRRAQAAIMQLEREAALREASLAASGNEAAALAEERRGQAVALQQAALELAAYERQVRARAGRGAAEREPGAQPALPGHAPHCRRPPNTRRRRCRWTP